MGGFCSDECRAADLAALKSELVARAVEVAEAFYGPANVKLSSRREARFGTKGSAKVTLDGARRGSWKDFEGDPRGGGLLDLIQFKRGGSFAEAVEWARHFTGYRPQPGRDYRAEAESRKAQQAQRAAEREAEAAQEAAHRIGVARALWARRRPAAGTPADAYLTSRAIVPPAAGWPDVVAFHPDSRALILAATLADGTVQGVQRVFLDEAGRKRAAAPGKPVKQSNGALDGAPVRLPGDPALPLLLAEGPETALSAWVATGAETWVLLGSLGKAQLPAGRMAVFCCDDDGLNSPAEHATMKAIRGWVQAGHDVKMALPWAERRRDGSDFNDLLQVAGAEAVRERIMGVLDAPPPPPRKRVPIKVAREMLAAASTGFFERALAHDPDGDESPPVEALRASVGTGKSYEARNAAARTLAALRARGDKRTVVFLVDRHQLGAEAAVEFEATPAARAAGLTAAIWRGRRADDPDEPGAKMCRDLERVSLAEEAGQPVQAACCSGKGEDGQRVRCPFFDGCAYQAQRSVKADVWFGAHNLLWHKKPEAMGDPVAMVIDESFWQSGLDGEALKRGAKDEAPQLPLTLTLDAIAADDVVPGDPADGMRLRFLRRLALDALRTAGDGPVQRGALLAAGLTSANAAEAWKLEWGRKVNAHMHPGMSVEARKAAGRAAYANRDLGRFVRFWTAARALLQPDGPDASGWAALATVTTKNGTARCVDLKGRHEPGKGWRAPVLVMDAVLDIDLVRLFFPDARLVAEVEAEAPHQHLIQVTGRSEAKSRYLGKGGEADHKQVAHGRDLVARLAMIGRAYADSPHRSLAIVQKDVREALPSLGMLPPSLDVAHFNSVAGLDAWKHAPALVIVGRTSPDASAVERIAEAVSGRAVPSIGPGQFPKVATWREMADGTWQATRANRHPDAIAEAVRWQICEGELIQAIGRPRGCNRGEDDPVDIWLHGDSVLPLPVAVTVEADAMDPGPRDRMLGLRGIAFQNPTDAATAFPELWSNRNTAKSALRTGSLGDSPAYSIYKPGFHPSYQLPGAGQGLLPVEYQRAGTACRRTLAFYDPDLVPDALATLVQLVGPLAWNSITDGPSGDPPRPNPSATLPAAPMPDLPPEDAEPPPVDSEDPGWSPDAPAAPALPGVDAAPAADRDAGWMGVTALARAPARIAATLLDPPSPATREHAESHAQPQGP